MMLARFLDSVPMVLEEWLIKGLFFELLLSTLISALNIEKGIVRV